MVWSISGYNGMQQADLSIRYLFTGSSASEVRTRSEFTYDNGRRLTDSKYAYALNGAGVSTPTYTLSNMNYNYKDQLIEKNLGYQSPSQALQSIDYTYNIRGWLTNINNANVYGSNNPIMIPPMSGSGYIQNMAISPFISKAIEESLKSSQQMPPLAAGELAPTLNDNMGDLFSENITYGSPDSRTGATPQYNGNISTTTWQVSGRDRQAYAYTYDDLDRLTDAKYMDVTDTYNESNGSWNSNYSTDNKFKETLQYDVRGNITSLQRNGLNGGSWTANGYTAATYGLIDNLTYIYVDSNRLKKVTETSLANRGFKYANSGNPRDFEYDKNGNLTADRNKSITNIEYNYLNLPQVITFAGNRIIQFVYDASGVKLQKIVNNNGTIATYDYVNGIEYKNSILQRIAHTEGAVVNQGDNTTFVHEFDLRDHLGNTRVTFSDANNDGIVVAGDIKQINHYYPFGLNMEGNWNGAQGDNKYQFNGKEWNDDFGLGWNDYGARFYDPAVARWGAVDPKSEKYYSMSPYIYVANNPIGFIDPNGKEIKIGKWFQFAFRMEVKKHLREISKNEDGRNLINSLENAKDKNGKSLTINIVKGKVGEGKLSVGAATGVTVPTDNNGKETSAAKKNALQNGLVFNALSFDYGKIE